MRSHLVRVIVAATFAAVAGSAQAASGCVKGGAVGAVGGHLMGQHGVVGAAAGCAIGHHQEKKKAKKEQQAANARAQAGANGTTATQPAQANAQPTQDRQNNLNTQTTK
jgi:hypothetical protein